MITMHKPAFIVFAVLVGTLLVLEPSHHDALAGAEPSATAQAPPNQPGADATKSSKPAATTVGTNKDARPRPIRKTVVSKDGTRIAYDRSGEGPVLILVASALSDRSGAARLAGLMARNFTVINHDRRGRGASGDTAPYAVEREIEDIEALIDEAGGSSFLFATFRAAFSFGTGSHIHRACQA